MLILLIIHILLGILSSVNAYKVIYAINAGGEAYRDKDRIFYDKDPLTDKIGIASDYGKQLMIIGRVPSPDEILYQTERYHTATFGYDLPLAGDGEYVLILKFCEVYFNAPNLKVFDIVLNGEHTVVADLDIFQQVGKGVAHDEYVYFTISRGKLYFNEDESEIRGNKIRIEFIKGYRDNPKINALVLIQGDVKNIPKLPSLDVDGTAATVAEHQQQQQQQQMQQQQQTQIDSDASEYLSSDKSTNPAKPRKPSGPKQVDPYALDDSSVMLPVFIAIGAFIPVLFCLCKL